VKLRPKQKYKIIKQLGLKVKTLCLIAGVSKSGYYKWLKHSDEPEKDCDDYLLIKALFDHGKAKYGFRTIKMKLLEKGLVMNKKKIIRIMKKYHLVVKIRRRNPYKMIMKKSLEHRTFENKLNRMFRQTVPLKTFSTDITYLPYNYRFAYLSVVKDLASGEVVAWNMERHLEMSLVLNTVENMKNNPVLTESVLSQAMIHSDQGFHYTNPCYIQELKKHPINVEKRQLH
jgi:transposase InsO family protein